MAINPHHGLNGFHILCVSDPMFIYVVNVIMFYVIADTMNTQVHDTTKRTPYKLVFGQPLRAIFVPDVNFRGQLDEDVMKPCDRENSEEGTKDKEQDYEGNEEEDEETEKDEEEKEKEDVENEEEHDENGVHEEEKDDEDEEKEDEEKKMRMRKKKMRMRKKKMRKKKGGCGKRR